MKFIRDIIKEKTHATPVEENGIPFVLDQNHLTHQGDRVADQHPSDGNRTRSVQEGMKAVENSNPDRNLDVPSDPPIAATDDRYVRMETSSKPVSAKDESQQDPNLAIAELLAQESQPETNGGPKAESAIPQKSATPVFNVSIKKPARENMSSNRADSERAGIGSSETPQFDESLNLFSERENTTHSTATHQIDPAPSGERRTGRVRTRLLGFGGSQHAPADPIAQVQEEAPPRAQFAVGWLVVTAGPGRGQAFTLHDGVAKIGRGANQEVRLDFGDNSISRENHAVVAYDRTNRSFYLGHGGKANLVRLRDAPVLSTEKMTDGDTIKIGETELRLVALCGDGFDWADDRSDDVDLSFG